MALESRDALRKMSGSGYSGDPAVLGLVQQLAGWPALSVTFDLAPWSRSPSPKRTFALLEGYLQTCWPVLQGHLGALGRAPEEASCSPLRLLTLFLVLLPPSQVHWGVRSLISLGLSPPLSTCLSGSVSLAGSSSLLLPPPPAKPLGPTSNCPEGNNGGAGLAGKEGGGENCSALRAPSPRPPSWGWGTHPELRSPAGGREKGGGRP